MASRAMLQIFQASPETATEVGSGMIQLTQADWTPDIIVNGHKDSMMQLKSLITMVTFIWLTACSSSAPNPQQYPQLYLESPKKLLIVVHGKESLPPALFQAFDKKVPEIVADSGFEVINPLALQVTEISALNEADAVLYVDIKNWDKAYSKILAAEAEVELEYTLVSAKTEQTLWHHQEHYQKSQFYLGGDILTEALYRTFFELSTVYEHQATSLTKKAFADFPEDLAANQ